MEQDARKFLRKMIKQGGFVARHPQNYSPVYWRSMNRVSGSFLNPLLFEFLKRHQLISIDDVGRYIITQKGIRFSRPWFIRMFYDK